MVSGNWEGFNSGNVNSIGSNLPISTNTPIDTSLGVVTPNESHGAYDISRNLITSYKLRERMGDAIESYVKLVRDPSCGDSKWATSEAYNIANVIRIITDAINKYTFQTWENNARNFSIVLQNKGFVEKNSEVVNSYTEAASKVVSSILSSSGYFSNTIRLLVGDREELGFAYAFIRRCPRNKLGYMLTYLGFNDVEFVLDETFSPCEFWIFTFVPLDKTKVIDSDNDEVCYYMTHIYRSDKEGEWITEYKCSKKVKKSAIKNNISYYGYGIPDEITDYCPVLYTRKNTNSTNPLGFGSGLICLSCIKEVHNGLEKKKELLKLISKMIAVYRRDGLNNEDQLPLHSHNSNLSNCSEADGLNNQIKEKTIPEKGSTGYYHLGFSGIEARQGAATLFNDSTVDNNVIKIGSIDPTLPMSDQFHLVPIDVDLSHLNGLLQDYMQIIEMVFDPNQFFNRGQSRMSVAEVNARASLDKLSSNDLTNPIIHDIVSPFIELIIRKNIGTLLHPDYQSKPKSLIKIYTDYLAPVEENEPIDPLVLETIIDQIKTKGGMELSWSGDQAEAKRQEAFASFANTISVIGNILQLKQVDQQFNTDGLLAQLTKISNVQIASQSSPRQYQPGLPPELANQAAIDEFTAGAEEL